MTKLMFATFLAACLNVQAVTNVYSPDLGRFGNAANIYPFFISVSESMRYQQVFAATDFLGELPYGGYITSMFLNADEVYPFYGTIVHDFQVNLSTTQGSPDALSSLFSDNVGTDDLVVRDRGRMAFYDSSGGSSIFGIEIPFTRPFFYDPRVGDLLLDVRNYSGVDYSGGEIIPTVDAERTTGDTVSRIYALNVEAVTAEQVDTIGLLTKFRVEPVPEPGTVALLALGLGMFGLRAAMTRKGRRQPWTGESKRP